MKNRGFSLLELMVVIALIGAMMAIVVPRIRGKNPKQEREEFLTQLNALTKFAWQNGVTSGKVQKIVFNFETNRITVWESTGKKDSKGELITTQVKKAYQGTTIKILPHLILKNFYIEGFDEVAKYGAGGSVTDVHFFIMPGGLTQSVIINFVDTKEKRAGSRGKPVGLVLNPFTTEFKMYGIFKEPS